MKLRPFIFLFLVLPLIVSVSCQNKYRPRFYIIQEAARQELALENSYFMQGYIISPNPGKNLMVPGAGAVVVTNQKSTHPGKIDLPAGLMTVEGEINHRIVIAIPETPVKDSLNIAGHSLCQLIGRYELPDSLNLYYCREGYMKIDSAKSSGFFAFLSGKYFNVKNDSLQFSGELRVKKKK